VLKSGFEELAEYCGCAFRAKYVASEGLHLIELLFFGLEVEATVIL